MVTSYPAMVLSRCRVLQTQTWYLAAVCDACEVPPWACIVMGALSCFPPCADISYPVLYIPRGRPLAGREKPGVLTACLQWASFLVVPESLRARAATNQATSAKPWMEAVPLSASLPSPEPGRIAVWALETHRE